jgi:hypothetical protein
MHPAICQGVPDRHLRQSESAHVCQEIHGQQVTKRKFPSRAAAVLAHYFFASRIGEQRGQPMAARVADRPCQAHKSVMVSFDSERSRLRRGSDIGRQGSASQYSFNR